MRRANETPQEVESSRLALERLFKAEDWQVPLRAAVLVVVTGLLVHVGVGDWPLLWAVNTLMFELLGYGWRRRLKGHGLSGDSIRRIHLVNDLIGHAVVVVWILGAVGLYLSGLMVGRLAGLLLLAAIGLSVSWQPGRMPYAAWLNAALPSSVMIGLTASELGTPEGMLRFGTALLFSFNVVGIAVVSMHSSRAMIAAHIAQKKLISELETAREDAEAGRRGAEEVARMKADFLAVMSHEVRTPLNGVLAMADILTRSKLDSDQRRQVDAIAESGRMLLGLVNDVLDASRLDAGQMRILDEPVDLERLLDRGLLPWRTRAQSQGLAFKTKLDTAAPQVIRSDGTRLKQILFNLVGNALKFTREGEIAVAVERLNGADGDFLRFSVQDSGEGIPESERSRVFERFTQVNTGRNRQHEGTGLGLSICKAFIELMGGEIGVESRPGHGSTFWFTLPCRPHEEETVEIPPPELGPEAGLVAPRPGHRAWSSVEEGNRLRVLVADDNAINRSVIEAMLQPLDAEMHMVCDGKAAVEAAETERFDLILMDVRMPVLDGIEAVRRIRRLPDCREVPILTLTAGDDAQEAGACSDAGADAHLTKPLSADALYACIGQLLDADNRAEIAHRRSTA